jgi:hypothetical protein
LVEARSQVVVPSTGLHQADDLAARPEHSISARWGVARLGSTEQ